MREHHAHFRAVVLQDFRDYLTTRDWHIGETLPKAEWWEHADVEILLPSVQTVSDYALRISQALDVVARFEGRSPDEVLTDVNRVGVDVIRVRVESSDPKLASIKLSSGAALIEQAFDLISAAAATAWKKKPVLAARRPKPAVDYMKALQLGQSEEGSYVVTILSRVQNGLIADDLLERDVPFPRLVTQNLRSALSVATAFSSAVNSSPDRLVAAGISANMCEALAELVDEDGGVAGDVDVMISWAPRLPEAQPVSSFRFSPDDIGPLKHAAEVLREEEPRAGILMLGVVTSLHRETEDPVGTVTIASIVDGKPRRLKAALSSSNYAVAVRAHGDRTAVIFSGDVVRTGRGFAVENITSFDESPAK